MMGIYETIVLYTPIPTVATEGVTHHQMKKRQLHDDNERKIVDNENNDNNNKKRRTQATPAGMIYKRLVGENGRSKSSKNSRC